MTTARREHDFYPTPDEAVKRLFSVVDIEMLKQEGWSFAEPCKGSGSFYKYFPEHSQYAEIQEGLDYFTTVFTPVDCIITNPPFSLAMEFLEKSLTEADVVIYLVRSAFLSSKKRKDFLKANPPTTQIVLSKRPCFTENGKTDKYDCSYFVWDKNNRLNLNAFYFV